MTKVQNVQLKLLNRELFHTQNNESLIQLQKIKLSQVFSLQYELSQPTIG